MSRSLNGTTDHLTQTDVPQLGTFSFACWVNPASFPSVSSDYDIICTFYEQAESEQFATHDKQLFVNSLGDVLTRVFAEAPTNLPKVASTVGILVLSTGVWRHLGISCDSTSLKVWVDGTEQDAEATGATSFTGYSNPSLRICGLVDQLTQGEATRSRFHGNIAEFGVWNRVLSSGEWLSLAAGSRPNTISSGLISYISFLTSSLDDEVLATDWTANGTTVSGDHPTLVPLAEPTAVLARRTFVPQYRRSVFRRRMV